MLPSDLSFSLLYLLFIEGSKTKQFNFFFLEILITASPGSNESKKIKQDLYYCDLIQYCLVVLKQDYTKVPGGWTTAAQIAEILR